MARRRSIFRAPSLNKRIAARTSVKRYVRHNLGFKAPRGWGWLTNPKRAAYNRVYNRTSIGCAIVPLLLLACLAIAGARSTERDRRQDARPPAATERPGAASSAQLPAVDTRTEPTPAAISVPSIAGKTPSQVAAVLGVPTGHETIRSHGRPLTKRYYRGGDVEIVYVDGKADWITIFGHGQLPFGPTVLASLGLPSAEPTFFNPAGVIRWEMIPGIREVSVFSNGDGNAHYAFVLVNSEP